MPILHFKEPNNTVKSIDYTVSNNKYLFFFHNAKCAGTTIKKLFNITKKGHDWFPNDLYLYLKNLKNYSLNNIIFFTSIRHPLDRWLSNYYFHTSNKDNFFYRKYGEKALKLSPEGYLELSLRDNVMPYYQWWYCKWFKNSPIPLYIIRYENFTEDLKRFCHLVKFPFKNLHENKTISRISYQEFFKAKPDLKNKLIKYFQKDFDLLGYKP